MAVDPPDFLSLFLPRPEPPKPNIHELLRLFGSTPPKKTILTGDLETPQKTAPSISESLVRIKGELNRAAPGEIVDGRTLPTIETLALAEGRKLKAAILYCDIRGFTSAVFSNPNKKILLVLDAFVSEMARITSDFNGSLVDCAGDRIMSVFHRPASDTSPKPIQEAVVCAFWMQTIIRSVLNPLLTEKGLPNILCGIGIDYGPVVIGRVGIRNKNKMVVIGNAANVAAKLEDRAAPGEVNLSKIVYASRPAHMKTHPSWVFIPKPTILTVEYYSCNLIYAGQSAPSL